MRHALIRFAAPIVALLATAAVAQSAADPNLWLEEIEGAKPLATVKAWNAETEDKLTRDPRYAERPQACARDPGRRGADRDCPTGSWATGSPTCGAMRRTRAVCGGFRPSTPICAASPEWLTVIDVDALGKQEGKILGLARRQLPRARLYPLPGLAVERRHRCRRGARIRPQDRRASSDRRCGFIVPEAKSEVNWIDRDTLLVATDWGAGSLTTSGYPRIAKVWKRGTPLAARDHDQGSARRIRRAQHHRRHRTRPGAIRCSACRRAIGTANIRSGPAAGWCRCRSPPVPIIRT